MTLDTTTAVQQLREAIRLTREYVGEQMLPAAEGWTWSDAIKATGGFDGFGGCGCVLDPSRFGRTENGDLRYCNLPAGHDGEHGRSAEPSATAARPGATGTEGDA